MNSPKTPDHQISLRNFDWTNNRIYDDYCTIEKIHTSNNKTLNPVGKYN